MSNDSVIKSGAYEAKIHNTSVNTDLSALKESMSHVTNENPAHTQPNIPQLPLQVKPETLRLIEYYRNKFDHRANNLVNSSLLQHHSRQAESFDRRESVESVDKSIN